MLPRHIVASQLKILMPVGTATANEVSMKKISTAVDIGVANMWWAQTNSHEGDAAVAIATAL